MEVGDKVFIRGWGKKVGTIKRVYDHPKGEHATLVIDGAWYDLPTKKMRPAVVMVLKPGNVRRTAVPIPKEE